MQSRACNLNRYKGKKGYFLRHFRENKDVGCYGMGQIVGVSRDASFTDVVLGKLS